MPSGGAAGDSCGGGEDASADGSSAATHRTLRCELCVCCQCGLGELGPPAELAAPFSQEQIFFRGSDSLDSVEREPASPPPRLA